jgi:hypothetical protein
VPHVYGIQKLFARGPSSTQKLWSNRSKRSRPVDTAPAIQIEIVAGDVGRTRYFLKVSTIDEKRLGHDLVRARWDELDSEDEEEGVTGREESEEDYIDEVAIASTARQLLDAAKLAGTTPILILPYLSRGEDYGLLRYLDSIGLRYHCRSDEDPIFDYAPGVPTSQSLNLPAKRITLDITTLLSVVADVCNMPPYSITYDAAIHTQADQALWEAKAPILPEVIFPFLETADELIAPPGVVAKMNKLLDTIGSDTEKQRAAVLFGTATSDEPLTDQYNKLGIYTIPKTISLPIQTVPVPNAAMSVLSHEDMEKISDEAAEVFNLAILHPEGSEVATANKSLAKIVRLHYFVERNVLGVGGRVLLHQPRSLRGFGKIVHLPMKDLGMERHGVHC